MILIIKNLTLAFDLRLYTKPYPACKQGGKSLPCWHLISRQSQLESSGFEERSWLKFSGQTCKFKYKYNCKYRYTSNRNQNTSANMSPNTNELTNLKYKYKFKYSYRIEVVKVLRPDLLCIRPFQWRSKPEYPKVLFFIFLKGTKM